MGPPPSGRFGAARPAWRRAPSCTCASHGCAGKHNARQAAEMRSRAADHQPRRCSRYLYYGHASEVEPTVALGRGGIRAHWWHLAAGRDAGLAVTGEARMMDRRSIWSHSHVVAAPDLWAERLDRTPNHRLEGPGS